MTTLTELKKICEAARAKGFACEQHLGYDGGKAGQYAVTLQAQQLEKLLAVVEAATKSVANAALVCDEDIALVEALAALEEE